jgi:glucokinase
MSHFLAGDIGGTNTRLSLITGEGAPLLQQSYTNAAYASLADILGDFLCRAGEPALASACLALAGPVSGRQAQLTNLPWAVDADRLAARFAIPCLTLINDFEAVGHGLAALQPSDLLTLQAGSPEPHGVKLAAGAGTGLGVAWLTWEHDGYAVHPSEGGHMDFAPQNLAQYELLCYLQQRHGHVSYERIVSGPGLVAIFDFLRDSGRAAPSEQLLAAIGAGDAAATIAQAAESGWEPAASVALSLFVEIYGAFVGNLALMTQPCGGIYIAGGIAAKIAPAMQEGRFLRAFCDKGRYADWLATLPLHLVTHPEIGLLGAERMAQSALNHPQAA